MRFRLGISLIQDHTTPLALRYAEFDFIKHAMHALLKLPESETPHIKLFVPTEFNLNILISKIDSRITVIRVHCDQNGPTLELQKFIDQHPCDIFFPFYTLPSFKPPGSLLSWIPYIDKEYSHLFYSKHAEYQADIMQSFLIKHSDQVIYLNHLAQQNIPSAANVNILPIVPHIPLSEQSCSGKNVLNKYSIKKNYIYVSSPALLHKNLLSILQAWNLLKTQNYEILLVCSIHNYPNISHYNDLIDYIKSNDLEENVMFLTKVTDDDEFHLIKQCNIVLDFSLCDSWNSRLDQAKILGKSIWASAIPAYQEQLGDKAKYCDDYQYPANIADFIFRNWIKLKKNEEKPLLDSYETQSINFARKLLYLFQKGVECEENPAQQLALQLSNQLYHSKTQLLRQTDDNTAIKYKIQVHFNQMEELNKQIMMNKDIMDTLNQKHTNTHYQNKAQHHSTEAVAIAEYPTTDKRTYTSEYLYELELYHRGLLNHYEKIILEQKETIKMSKELIEELLEKHEALYQKNTINTQNSFTQQASHLMRKVFRKIFQNILEIFRFKLGRLYIHPPKLLVIPKSYYTKAPQKNKSDLPSISIVTPAFQQGSFIERTIISVTSQNYPNLEYIIQDGGSKDETVDIIKNYQSHIKSWESKSDNGQSHAINIGFTNTTGEIMAYLNSDDILLPGTLDYVGRYFAEHPEIDVVYGHRVLIDEFDHEIGRWVLPPHNDEILSWADYVPQETLFWRREIWNKAGGQIDESFRFAMDWDLILRFRDAGAKFVRLPRFLGAFRIHPHQKTSAAITKIGISEMRRLRKRCHGRPVSQLELDIAVRPYLKQHRWYNMLYKAGLIHY